MTRDFDQQQVINAVVAARDAVTKAFGTLTSPRLETERERLIQIGVEANKFLKVYPAEEPKGATEKVRDKGEAVALASGPILRAFHKVIVDMAHQSLEMAAEYRDSERAEGTLDLMFFEEVRRPPQGIPKTQMKDPRKGDPGQEPFQPLTVTEISAFMKKLEERYPDEVADADLQSDFRKAGAAGELTAQQVDRVLDIIDARDRNRLYREHLLQDVPQQRTAFTVLTEAQSNLKISAVLSALLQVDVKNLPGKP